MRPQGAELSCIQLSLNTKIGKELSNFGCGAATISLKKKRGETHDTNIGYSVY
jgi:hypothetical protein